MNKPVEPGLTAAAPYAPQFLYIDGEFIGADQRAGQDVRNPATGQAIGRLPHAPPDDLQRALKAAERAFATWKGQLADGSGRPFCAGSATCRASAPPTSAAISRSTWANRWPRRSAK